MRYLLLLLLLSGCASSVVSSGPRSVTMSTFMATEQSAQSMAEAHCQKQGLHAKVNQRDQDYARIVYDCVP